MQQAITAFAAPVERRGAYAAPHDDRIDPSRVAADLDEDSAISIIVCFSRS
jgi:hypothetical protein